MYNKNQILVIVSIKHYRFHINSIKLYIFINQGETENFVQYLSNFVWYCPSDVTYSMAVYCFISERTNISFHKQYITHISFHKQYITLTTSSFWNKKTHQFVFRVDNNCHRHTVTFTFFDWLLVYHTVLYNNGKI